MQLRAILGALFLFFLCIAAHAQDARVVTTCGTLPQAYAAGSTQLPTVDVNGKLCLQSASAPAASPTFTGTVTMPDSGTWGSGGINGSIIGGTTAAAGSFTTLAANSTANFTGTFQINSNTITWPAAAISVARTDAAQTFTGNQTIQASGATGSNSSLAGSVSTATNGSQSFSFTNDTGAGTGNIQIINSAGSGGNLTNIAHSLVMNANGTSSAGLFLGTRSNSAPVVFFTGSNANGNKRGQIGGTSGGWCIGNCTTDNGAGTLVTTANLTVGGHALATGGAPAVSSCGSSPGTPAGSDNFGRVVAGGGVLTSCVINFGTTWGAAPSCTVSSPSAIASLTVSTSTTQITIGGTSLTGDTISWVCGSTS